MIGAMVSMIATTFLYTMVFFPPHLTCISMPQKEKQVLALLSKLDAQNINLTESLPGECLVNSLSWLMQFANKQISLMLAR